MIDEVRQSADIVDIVSDYVKLHPSGRNYKALSPFVQEKTPSFIVSPDKQIYKCFSSGKGGNVFTFIMEMEKVSFPEAVEMAAKRTGIDVSRYTAAAEHQKENKDESRFGTLRWAARTFYNALASNDGRHAYAYLVTNRGIEPGTIKKFGLGYAPDQWDFLLHAAQKDGIPVEHLTELGLVTRHRERNSLYDTFRHRIIFPVFSIGGQVAGFGGRTLGTDPQTPKYLNSPESATFEKSRLLYGMHTAKDSIRRQEQAILVEGYMDVLALHQAGLTNAAASCGTALTPYQARILHRYTSRVLFLYDGDNAGRKSMLSGIDILVAEGITPWIVIFPPGEDPDSFVRHHGAERFRALIDKEKLSFQDFQLHCYREAGNFASPDLKSKAIASMVKTIASIPDPVQKELYLEELAKKTDLSRQTLLKIMPSGKESKYQGALRKSGTGSHPEKPKPEGPLTVTERTFLEALLESTFYGSEVLAFAASHENMLSLSSPPAQAIFSHLIRRYREIQNLEHHFIDISSEISSIDTEEAKDLALEILFRLPVHETSRQAAYETLQHARRCLSHFLIAVKNLVMEPLLQEKQSIIASLPEAAGKTQEKELFIRLNELNKQIKSMDQEVSTSINTILESNS
jgi:DNA primase